jgi:carboxymethylenebutenolidase
MLHFGKKDQHLPPSEIETIRRHRADLPLFLYDAGHGFNCDRRDSYDAPSAAPAQGRTLAFLRKCR